MSLLLPANATVDIYRGFDVNKPYPSTSTSAAVTGVGGQLKHHVRNGRFGSAADLKWTHILYLPLGTDVRGAYNSQLNTWQPANADTVVLADFPIAGWCTAFVVVLVQRVQRGAPGDCLRVHLDRVQPRFGPCSVAPPVGCCQPPNPPIPDTVYATVAITSGCPCLQGLVIPLTASPTIPGIWTGDASSGCSSGDDFFVSFDCSGADCSFATISVFWENHDPILDAPVDPGCDCNPLHLVFPGLIPNPLGPDCFAGFEIDITA